MPTCTRCGSDIPKSAKYCPQCAHPVADPVSVARSSHEKESSTEKTWLYCAKCGKPSWYQLDPSKASHHLVCKKCDHGFKTRLVQIRAKRSRGSKKDNKRHFSIRVVEASGREDLIEFTNRSYEDFELRSDDLAAFSYLGNDLKLVQNITIGKHWKLSDCYLATHLYGSTSKEVTVLRLFRDEVLLTSELLSPIVKEYYRLSPVLIDCFGDRRAFCAASRALVGLVVRIIDFLHNPQSNKP